MKKLRTILCAVSALVLTSMTTSPLMADSSNFAGPYIGFNVAAAGVELDGKHKEGTVAGSDVTASTTTGSVGKTAIIGGLELGYAFPLGDAGVLVDIGAAYNAGGAKIRTKRTMDSIVLYMPSTIQTNTNAVYKSPEMGNLAMTMGGAASSVWSRAQEIGIWGAIKEGLPGFSDMAIEDVQRAIAKVGSAIIGGDIVGPGDLYGCEGANFYDWDSVELPRTSANHKCR